MKKLHICFLIFLIVFCGSKKCMFCQICDTIVFDYEMPLDSGFILQTGSVQLNKMFDSCPIIGLVSFEDTISSMIYLHVFLNRKNQSTKYLMMKRSEIFFIALTDSIRGKVNKICFFNQGKPPAEMAEELGSLWSLLDCHILEIINSWTWKLIDEDIDSMPLAIDFLVPLHCNLVMNKSLIDKFNPINKMTQ